MVCKRNQYEKLFYNILPYISPNYTPLKDPPMKNLVGVDTNQGWMNALSARRLNEFLDVSLREKEFFLLWNSFIIKRVNRSLGISSLPYLLKSFVETHGNEILKQNLLINFVLHCSCLRKFGYINSSQMFDSILLFENLK